MYPAIGSWYYICCKEDIQQILTPTDLENFWEDVREGILSLEKVFPSREATYVATGGVS